MGQTKKKPTIGGKRKKKQVARVYCVSTGNQLALCACRLVAFSDEKVPTTIPLRLYEKQRLAEVTAVKQRLSDSLRGVAKGVIKPVPQRDAMKASLLPNSSG